MFALVLQGWPQAVGNDHDLVKLLTKRNYEVLAPHLLEMKEELNVANILKLVKKEPDIILGMSMGGFFVPFLAQKYPKAKLVFIATTAKLEPKTKIFKYLVGLIASDIFGVDLVKILLKMAPLYMKWWYGQLTSNGGSGDYLKSDIDKSIKELELINAKKHHEAAKFISKSDNLKISRGLLNKTLVLSGDLDIIMPPKEGKKLADCFRNGKFIVTGASHYNVLNEQTYKIIDEFL